jgi:hypothetical protein
MGLSFTIAAGLRQRSHSRVRIPTIFYRLRFETPQPGGPGTHIYIPQEQGGPGIPPGIGFPFRRILWLAGMRLHVSVATVLPMMMNVGGKSDIPSCQEKHKILATMSSNLI